MTTTICYNPALSYGLAASALILFLVIFHAPLATSQPLPWQLCNDTAGNFAENSAYQANIRRLASALPGNASSSPSLFTTGAAGTAPDVVYSLALCRGDINASSCARCVAAAFQNAQQLCALSKGATMYDDPCILRYADWDFLANATDNRGTYIAWSSDSVSASALGTFRAAFRRLVDATADYAAADPVRRFGTGDVAFDETYPKIYSLAQCTPDMAAADCRTCLGNIIKRFMPMYSYFTGKHGGRLFGVRCSFRFETYPFFSGRPLLQNHRIGWTLAIAVPLAAAILGLTVTICFCFWSMRTSTQKSSGKPYSPNPDDIQVIDSLLLDLYVLREATDNFSESNKLGEGGFIAVYKGVLSDGQEIAVKRLSLGSRQGVQELKSISCKLQHKNLMRLKGVCLEEQEKLLVYEYMPKTSLDTIIFESQKSKELDWVKRLKIINGVARGLQYLHEDSQLKIVHRDLKPSNVLLDFDYNPKISDYGLAKLFDQDQSQGITSHIAETYGYMAPEYAMHGQYSVKSDVFSLGVLILEMVTGRKNTTFDDSEQSVDLLSLVWEHWTKGATAELLDPFLLGCRAPQDQMSKLVNIGLLFVQDSPADQPMVSSVNIMLSSDMMGDHSHLHSDAYNRAKATMSPNEVSLTELEPR
uniref:Cysteine-rich receptor-like protein kinase 10 n=1 Tax=Setaria italica TaxID=4555 RepID=K3ZF86_SETIT